MKWDDFKIIGVVFLIIVLILGLGVWSATVQNATAYKSGQEAAEAGMPATVNPYVGDRYGRGGAWLDGYMSKK